MSAPHADQIVEGYLARLEVALTGIPAARRSELVDEVRAHIAEGRAASPDETDATLFELMERLGDPRLIAAEALERSDERPAPASTPVARWGWLELAAILLSIVMWPVGAILVLLSRAWTRREKLIGAGVGAIPFLVNTLFAPVLPMLMGPLVGGGSSVPVAVPMLFAVIGALPLLAAGYLALRLYGRSSYLPGLAT